MIRMLRLLFSRLRAEERGVVLVLVGAAMFGLIGMTALTVDVARYFELRRQLQNGVDAAAHAAAVRLTDGQGAAAAAATEYWDLNEPSLGDATLIDVSFPGGADTRVRVEAEATIGFLFAPLLGFSDATIVSVVAIVASDAQPIEVVVVLDRSGSMCRDSHGLILECPDPPPQWEPFTQVQAAAIAFPDSLITHTDDRLGLVSYSTEASRDMPISQGYAGYTNQVENLEPTGWTNIGHAIAEAADMLTGGGPNPDAQKIIVLLSDGVPNIYPDGGGGWTNCGSSGCAASYNYGRTEAANAADDGIDIFTIGLGLTVDGDYLQELATTGNGAYVFAPTGEALQEAFETIARLINIRFVE